MYLKIEELSDRELKKLELMFGKRLSAFHNIHYQLCVDEIVNAIENSDNEEGRQHLETSDFYAIEISEMAQELYSYIFDSLDEIYDKAVDIVESSL